MMIFSKALYIISTLHLWGAGGDTSLVGLKLRRKSKRLNRWARRA